MTRYVYLARHGEADPFGEITDTGREQAALLGRRLAHLPIGAVWHSPLPPHTPSLTRRPGPRCPHLRAGRASSRRASHSRR